MEAVEAELVTNPDQDKEAGRQADGQAEDVEEGRSLAELEFAQGDLDMAGPENGGAGRPLLAILGADGLHVLAPRSTLAAL